MASNQPYNPKFLSYRVVAVTSTPLYTDGQNVDPSADNNGATLVNAIPAVHPPPAGYGEQSGYGNSFPVNGGSPCILLTVNGFLDSGSAVKYVQFFDFGAPAPGDAPVQCFRLNPGSAFSWTPAFSRIWAGLVLALSDTPNTYTPNVDNMWHHVEWGTP